MSALGQKRTLATCRRDVCFTPESGTFARALRRQPLSPVRERRGPAPRISNLALRSGDLAAPEITSVAELRHFVTADTGLAVLETLR